ncbi:MAG: hypothetical protein ABSC94_33915, partial [Polyangiaceae bacterium]
MIELRLWVLTGLLLLVGACAKTSVPPPLGTADGATDATVADGRGPGDSATDGDAGVNTCNGTTCSDGGCVYTMNDPANCGGCGIACAADEACQGGFCLCVGTESHCGDAGACVNKENDESNCGQCGAACASGATCVNSACECPTGQTVCGVGSMQACSDINNDPNNCGGCGISCSSSDSCVGATCLPCGTITTQILCGTVPQHCVSSATDPANCGGCGNTCLSTQVCMNSQCVCPGSEMLCGPDAGGSARCYDLSVDPDNCGSCGKACSGGAVCQGGNCVCPSGTHSCGTGTAAKCLSNTSTSSCGTTSCSVCPVPAGGLSTCDGTSCGQSCPDAGTSTLCPAGGGANAACVDLKTNASNCGACGAACSTVHATESCAASTCGSVVCSAGYGNCDGLASNGCEIDLDNNASNCGSCGHVCSGTGASEVCTNAACTVSTCTVAGTANCDGNAANGCEVNTTDDPKNCGGCGDACSTNNATESCVASKCVITTCTAGFKDCDGNASNGCEVNTTDDANNCGACGTKCSQANGTGTCVASTCRITCDAGFANCDDNVTNGCETSTTTTANCGSCGNACSTADATEACSSTIAGYECSVVSCTAGYQDCDHSAANGCEVDIETNANDCGGCGKACTTVNGTKETCQAGACSAAICTNPLYADCNGSVDGGCSTAITTTTNCGACYEPCSTNHVTEQCTATAGVYSCVIPPTGCAAGYADCDKNPSNGCEVDTNTDVGNCGGCGQACMIGGSCVAGGCGCGAGTMLCGGECPTCPVIDSGSLTCSGTSCVQTCPSGDMLCDATCVKCPSAPTGSTFECSLNGSCVIESCPSGDMLCGGTCAVCPAGVGTVGCSGTSCVVQSCPTGYMECGSACSPCPSAPVGATFACSAAGACEIASCPSGTM